MEDKNQGYKSRKVFRTILKWLLRVIAAFVVLFLLIVIALQFPAVQTYITGRIVEIYSDRTGTRMEVEKVSIRLPTAVGLKGIYVEDAGGDTLLYAGDIRVDINIPSLIRNRIQVNNIEIDELYANIIKVEPDTVFNFQFIVEAFAGNADDEPAVAQEPQPSDAEGGMDINLNRISLNDIRVRFDDYQAGIDIKVQLGELDTRVTLFDLDSFAFHLGDTELKNTNIDLLMSDAEPKQEKEPEQQSPDLDLMLGNLSIDNLEFNMLQADGSTMEVIVPEFEVLPQRLDINQNVVYLDYINAADLVVNMENTPSANNDVTVDNDSEIVFNWSEIFAWDIQVGAIDVGLSQLSMTTSGSSNSTSEFDPQNLVLNNVVLDAENIKANSQAVSLNLKQVGARFSDGFTIEELSAVIELEDSLRIENLTFITGQTTLRMDLYSSIDPLEFSASDFSTAEILLEVREGLIASDLSYFYPPLQEYFVMAGNPESLQFTTLMQGNMGKLDLDHFNLDIPGLVIAQLSGQINGLPDTETLILDLSEISIGTRPGQLVSMLPDTLKPEGIVLPDTLSLEGFFRGGMKNFNTELELASSMGDINLDAEFADDGLSEAQYMAEVELHEIDPGLLLDQQETFGTISANISLKGTGLDPKTADGVIELVVENATFNQYEYTNLEIDGHIKEGVLTASIEYEDDNLALLFNQKIFLKDDYPQVKLDWELVQANLQALNLTGEQVLVRGEVTADMTLTSDDFAQGNLAFSQIHVLNQNEAYSLASVVIESSIQDEQYMVSLNSPVLQADYTGNMSPVSVPEALIRHLDSYFDLALEADTAAPAESNFELEMSIPPSDWLTELLMPQLSFPEPLTMTTSFDSKSNILSIDASLREVAMGENYFRDINLKASTDNFEGNFSAGIQNIEIGNLTLTNFMLDGQLKDSIIDFSLAFDDQFQNLWLSLPATLEARGQSWELSLDPELIINRQEWQASSDNHIVFAPGFLKVNNFKLENQGRYLLVRSLTSQEVGITPEASDNPTMPLDITFNQFDLNDFSILEEDPLAGGLFNGTITIKNLFTDLAFTADLEVSDFALRGDTLGNININASNPRSDQFVVDASVSGHGTEILVEGEYQAGEDPLLDLIINLQEVNLASLEGFMGGELTETTGNISGMFNVQGQPSSPSVEGSLNFKDVGFDVTYLSSSFSIPDETIQLEGNQVRFDSFTLHDNQERKASLDGFVDISEISQPEFALRLRADNFLLLNIPEGQNDLLSGTLRIDSDLRLKGVMSAPVIDGRVRLNEGSSLSFTIPQTEPEAVGAEGVVSFISYTDTLFQDIVEPTEVASYGNESFQNLDLSVNIEVDPKTQLKIVIDEVAGDNLEITGGGTLSFGIDPGGNMSLAGRYDISGGSYLLTFYDAIRRNFSIQEGSSLQWRGDPMNALVDITAIYTVSTTARELLISQMEDGSTESGALRQQFPFQVSLIMRGELEKPDISFGISLPEEYQNALDGRVQTRLTALNQTPSELNKQVFALLVLGNFIHENPFESLGEGPGLSSTARSSASRILSQQLNRLSDRYVRGVDLNFDVESYEDYSTGEAEGRTELQMEVSKNFLDERLRITVGGNLELEDESRQNTDPGEIAGDFLLEYLFDKDGNLILKVFRKKDYGDLFDAQVFETGVALLFTRSYNVFKEIFRSKEKTPVLPDDEEQK